VVAGAPPIAWQASLLDAGADAAPDVAFASLTRTDLGLGAWVDHAPGWMAGGDDLFSRLVSGVAWQARSRHMYDKVVDEPRLSARWDLPPAVPAVPAAVPGAVLAARAALTARYRVAFDSAGLNLYRDGRDSVAWHGDRIARTVEDPIVAIVSLGSPRRFLLRPAGGGRSRRFDLSGGDLLVMGGTCQRTWQHTVPKVAAAGPRMSVTFRHSR
jgi:alkylated DNA repair dioxygenase AlkB